MSRGDFQVVPTSEEAADLALLAADASDLEANEANPSCCQAQLQGWLAKAFCTVTLIWAVVCLVVTIISPNGGWRVLMACLPGFTLGMRLAYLASQDAKKLAPDDRRVRLWCIPAVPTFLILSMLPMLEMPWKIVALEVVAAVASFLGLQLIGLFLAWLGFLCLALPLGWQTALCVFPGILCALCFPSYVCFYYYYFFFSPLTNIIHPKMQFWPQLFSCGCWHCPSAALRGCCLYWSFQPTVPCAGSSKAGGMLCRSQRILILVWSLYLPSLPLFCPLAPLHSYAPPGLKQVHGAGMGNGVAPSPLWC